MRLFTCTGCGQRVYFDSFACTRCGASVGYLPDQRSMSALRPRRAPSTRPIWETVDADPRAYRPCRNATEHDACNWMIPHADPLSHCAACRLTVLAPDIDAPGALDRWRVLERSKRHLLHHVAELGLPLDSRHERPKDGLAFVFLAQGDLGREAVLTGHANGLVTININEADDAYREKMRVEMRESYRTVLGHFRHEIGHYYWDRLIRGSTHLAGFRSFFGDERQDYAARCRRHYAEGPPLNWVDSYVSAYATMHPWEDWAESWSHYLHITDTLDTAAAYGLVVEGLALRAFGASEEGAPAMSALLDQWFALSATLNSLNRSMGQADPYPFVLSTPAIAKLAFVHDVVCQNRRAPKQPRA